MNKNISKIITFAAIAGLALAARGADDSDQLASPVIKRQPKDQAILIGSTAVFTAQAVDGAATYQWLRNGVPLKGQTNSNLILKDVGIDDVGFHLCKISNGEKTVPTRAALLNVYVDSGCGGPIMVYGWPVVSSGSQGGCPGAYAGYVNYIKPVSQGWGW